MNPYEAACDRFNEASRNFTRVQAEADRMLADANAEYEAAEDNLRRYESRPGIPLPEYRKETAA